MFIVIDSDTRGRPRFVVGDIDYQGLVNRLDDMPVSVDLPDTGQEDYGPLVAWVGDEYIRREIAGEVTRNVFGSVLLWGLGATRQPYGGSIVITGVHDSAITGRIPAPLSVDAVDIIERIFEDISAVLTGRAPHPLLTDRLIDQFKSDAVRIEEMKYDSQSMWKDVGE